MYILPYSLKVCKKKEKYWNETFFLILFTFMKTDGYGVVVGVVFLSFSFVVVQHVQYGL